MQKDQILRALHTFFSPGDVFEVRILGAVEHGATWAHTASGYFDHAHIGDVPNAIANYDTYSGVYVTINPVNPALLSRAANRIKQAQRGLTTSDEDIVNRRWLFVDVDPVRPAGIASTAEETAAAFAVADTIADRMRATINADAYRVASGNGAQLLYPVDLPADDGGLIRDVLTDLSRHSTAGAEVDMSVHNAARICRLPGTTNRKGDPTDERPHRLATMAVPTATRTPRRLSATDLRNVVGTAEPAAIVPAPVTLPRDNDTADEFNRRGSLAQIIEPHGWVMIRDGHNQAWRRPGKTDCQLSATFRDGVFYVFSAAAAPFEPGRGYSLYGVYSMLNHNNDFAAAREALLQAGYGERPPEVDMTALLAKIETASTIDADAAAVDIAARCVVLDDGDIDITPAEERDEPFPAHLLDVPGLIGDTANWIVAGARKPQPTLALAAVLPMMGVLCGQKIKTSCDTRTNIYTLGVCGTGGGKEAARQGVKKILYLAGGEDLIGPEGFASGAGMISSLDKTPVTLCQIDEIGRTLRSLSSVNAPPHLQEIVTNALKMYSSANSVFLGSAYADAKTNKSIDQPCLCIHGTTVPQSLYDGLTAESITDGFLARFLVFGVDDNDPPIRRVGGSTPPDAIVDAARYWVQYTPGGGDLSRYVVNPAVVHYGGDSDDMLFRFAQSAQKIGAETTKRTLAGALWTRAAEKATKLALLYAASENRGREITEAAARWAIELTEYLTRYMIKKADTHISGNQVEKRVKMIFGLVLDAGENGLSKTSLYRQTLSLKKLERDEALHALMEARKITLTTRGNGSARPTTIYKSTAF